MPARPGLAGDTAMEELFAFSCCQAGPELLVEWLLWSRSGQNRDERRAARREGRRAPRPDAWTWGFWLMTGLIVVTVAIAVVGWLFFHRR